MVVLPLFSIISGMGILNNVAAGRTVLIILYVGINVPYTTIFLLTFFSNISRTYEEAAAIDGCPPMRTFWKIMFPMAQSGIVTVTIFNFINIWNEYFLSLIFASSDKLKPVAPGLYGMINSMKYTGDWAGMFAAVIIVFLPTFILYIFLIMDFSIYDAVQAGFQKVVFIIKKENEADFRSAIGDRLSNQLEVSYVFQDLHNIPEGYEVPEGRVKPWGTGHAVLSCINEIDGPFVVINADDYYGSHAFKMAYDFLTENEDTADTYRYMMVGYKLENTLTENGHVARGVCVTDEEGHLLKINERTHIEKHDGGTAYTEDDGKTWTMLPEGSTVSMNMWGFSASILKELKDRFPKFLDENLKVNPLKCEYFLPFVVDELLGEKRATVKVLKSMDKWYGVTYKEDKPVVVAAIQNLKDGGLYPQKLWEE